MLRSESATCSDRRAERAGAIRAGAVRAGAGGLDRQRFYNFGFYISRLYNFKFYNLLLDLAGLYIFGAGFADRIRKNPTENYIPMGRKNWTSWRT